MVEARATTCETVVHRDLQGGGVGVELFVEVVETQPEIEVAQARGGYVQAAHAGLDHFALGLREAINKIVYSLVTATNGFAHASERSVLREFRETQFELLKLIT